jgi:hypothetical protein
VKGTNLRKKWAIPSNSDKPDAGNRPNQLKKIAALSLNRQSGQKSGLVFGDCQAICRDWPEWQRIGAGQGPDQGRRTIEAWSVLADDRISRRK